VHTVFIPEYSRGCFSMYCYGNWAESHDEWYPTPAVHLVHYDVLDLRSSEQWL
jgi:hypothetical protein